MAPDVPEAMEKFNHYRWGVARLIEPKIIIMFLLMKLWAAVFAEESQKHDMLASILKDMNEKVSDFNQLRCECLHGY